MSDKQWSPIEKKLAIREDQLYHACFDRDEYKQRIKQLEDVLARINKIAFNGCVTNHKYSIIAHEKIIELAQKALENMKPTP